MASVKVDENIWDLIVAHYASISSPTSDDRKVMDFIADKLNRQMRREDFKEMRRMNREDFRESQARYARLRDWTNKTEG